MLATTVETYPLYFCDSRNNGIKQHLTIKYLLCMYLSMIAHEVMIKESLWGYNVSFTDGL